MEEDLINWLWILGALLIGLIVWRNKNQSVKLASDMQRDLPLSGEEIRGMKEVLKSKLPEQQVMRMSEHGLQKIGKLVRRNELIPAITEIRKEAGTGLKESKDAVDILRGMMNKLSQVPRGPDSTEMVSSEKFTQLQGLLKPYLPDETIALLPERGLQVIQDQVRSGQLINAIKDLRELTGLGLKESKDIIDQLKGHL